MQNPSAFIHSRGINNTSKRVGVIVVPCLCGKRDFARLRDGAGFLCYTDYLC